MNAEQGGGRGGGPGLGGSTTSDSGGGVDEQDLQHLADQNDRIIELLADIRDAMQQGQGRGRRR